MPEYLLDVVKEEIDLSHVSDIVLIALLAVSIIIVAVVFLIRLKKK